MMDPCAVSVVIPTRNAGLATARGELCLFFDDDLLSGAKICRTIGRDFAL